MSHEVDTAYSSLSGYDLRWLVRHLLSYRECVQAASLLVDLDYLMQRVADLPSDVRDRSIGVDWVQFSREAKLEGDVAVWESFWRAHEHYLLRATAGWPAYKILLQLAWEHGADSPVSAAAQSWIDDGECNWTWARLKPKLRPRQSFRSPCVRVLAGHIKSVYSLAQTRNPPRLVSGGGDNALRVWDPETGSCLRTFRDDFQGIRAIVALPDGVRVLAGCGDKSIREYDVRNGELVGKLDGHEGAITALAATDDGRILVSGSSDRSIRVWDMDTRKCRRALRKLPEDTVHLAITPDGERMVMASHGLIGCDPVVHLFDLRSLKRMLKFQGHSGAANSVAIAPDGQHALSGGDDGSIHVWDTAGGRCLRVLRGHSAGVTALALEKEGNKIVSGAEDRDIRVWDLHSGECLAVFQGHTEAVQAVAVGPDGRWAFSGSNDESIRVWDLRTTMSEGHRPQGHSGKIRCMGVAGRSKRAVTGGEDGMLRVWSLESGKCLSACAGHEGRISSVVLTADERIAISCGEDERYLVWDVCTGQLKHTLTGGSLYQTVDMSSIGTLLCVSDFLRSLRDPDQAQGLTERRFELGDAVATPDGQRVITGLGDRVLHVWDLKTGGKVTTLAGHTDQVVQFCVTADSKRAVSASIDKSLRLWDLATGVCLSACSGDMFHRTAIALASDGSFAAIGDADGGIRIWGLDTGRDARVLHGHRGRVRVVTLANGDRQVLSGGADGTVRLWDITTGECLHVMKGHSDQVYRIGVTSDGVRAVSIAGIQDATIHVWNLMSGQCEERYSKQDHRIPPTIARALNALSATDRLAVHPDGVGVTLYNRDGRVATWCSRSTDVSPRPFLTDRPIVFDEADGVTVLRVLELVHGARLMTLDKTTGVVCTTE